MADIVLLDGSGASKTYEGLETVTIPTPDSGEQVFETQKAREHPTVDLDFSGGDTQEVKPSDGAVLDGVTISKPETLVPDNIVDGVEIAGVIGTHEAIDYVGRTISVIYDPTVKGIASYAFYYHTSLMSVNFPNCSAVGSGAFRLCANLQHFSAQNCKRVETSAFDGCSKLIQVYVPDCTLIGSNAFQSCGSLNTVIVGQSSATGGFLDTNGAVHVSGSAFNVCLNLASVLDKDGNNALIKFTGSSQSYVFGACRKLEQIGLYSNQYYGIPKNAFSGCWKLSLIESGMISSGSRILFSEIGVMNTSTYGIGVGAFGQCSSITQLKFKTTGGFFKVDDMAFISCKRLSQLFLDTEGVSSGSSFYSIQSRVFEGTPIANSTYLGYYGSIYVPSSHISKYKASPGWSYYSNRFVAYDFINDKVAE